MTLWAIVPMRGLRTGKQRLAGAMTPLQREALNGRMLEGVLHAAARALGDPGRCIVQSADPRVVDVVRARGAIGQLDMPGAGLNGALDQARDEARRRGADRLLILSADLPWITPQDVRSLIDDTPMPSIAMVADKTGTGTNGLIMPAMIDFQFEFGADSLNCHLQQCVRLNWSAHVWRTQGLQFDLDTEDDLDRWRRRRNVAACRAAGELPPASLREMLRPAS